MRYMTIKNIDIYSEMNGSYVVDKDKEYYWVCFN